MRLTDLAAAADLAHAHGARLVVDNTFASPVLQQPIAFGADLVTHSTTKYLNGHSDSVGGVVIATRDDDVEWLRLRAERGRAPSSARSTPGWCCAAPRRCRCACSGTARTASALAEFLAAHPAVQQGLLPGPAVAPAARAGGAADARIRRHAVVRSRLARGSAARCSTSVRLLALAESLGGVESLISHPATMTHASVPVDQRDALGITDGLVRISAGLEDLDDLKDDLGQALARV